MCTSNSLCSSLLISAWLSLSLHELTGGYLKTWIKSVKGLIYRGKRWAPLALRSRRLISFQKTACQRGMSYLLREAAMSHTTRLTRSMAWPVASAFHCREELRHCCQETSLPPPSPTPAEIWAFLTDQSSVKPCSGLTGCPHRPPPPLRGVWGCSALCQSKNCS